jgi:hypothetical protein
MRSLSPNLSVGCQGKLGELATTHDCSCNIAPPTSKKSLLLHVLTWHSMPGHPIVMNICSVADSSRISKPPAVCAALRMSSSSQPPGKKKAPKLGPGLFAPDIQLGPEEAWKKDTPVPMLDKQAVERLFEAADADQNDKINKEEVLDLARSLGRVWGAQTLSKVRARESQVFFTKMLQIRLVYLVKAALQKTEQRQEGSVLHAVHS